MSGQGRGSEGAGAKEGDAEAAASGPAGGSRKKGRAMPAGAEAVRAERAARRAERAAQAAAGGSRANAGPAVPDTGEGPGLIRATWTGTALFVLGAIIAATIPDARFVVAIMDVALFLGGCGLFFWTLVVAARRSREVEIGLWSLFLLEGVAPRRVRVRMLSPIGVEIAVALATAWIAGPLAFGILVPVWALGCSGLWGAKYGRFTVPRQVSTPPRRRHRSGPGEG
jgi:hypothetical protein